MTIRKAAAWLILILLIVTPFINWRLGAVIWLCAWIIYVLQMLFAVRGQETGSRKQGGGSGGQVTPPDN